jgi:hypothetical protein
MLVDLCALRAGKQMRVMVRGDWRGKGGRPKKEGARHFSFFFTFHYHYSLYQTGVVI